MSGFTRDDLLSIGMREAEVNAYLRSAEIEADLRREQPGLHPITAHIIAGDIASAERATERVAAGEDPEHLLLIVGSYARWTWAREHLPPAVFAERICELWRGADPDDTSAANEAIWCEAYDANGHRPLYDERPLPAYRSFTVYRGQRPEQPLGMAWSRSRQVADKFARGAGERVPVPGVLLRARIDYEHVLAYITGRGEREVVLLPDHLVDVQQITAYSLVPRNTPK